MQTRQCVDASFIVALLIPEQFSPVALELWQAWVEEDNQPVAPLLLRYEVTSALYRKALREQVSTLDARLALKHFLDLDIEWIDPPELPLRATELAEQFHLPTTYDAHYLALAESLDSPLWSTDERLFNSVHSAFPWMRWLGKLSYSQ